MLYAGSTLSLACLEMLVHLPPNQIPIDLVYSWAELKETPAAADFRGDVADQDSTRFGQRWATGVEAAAIRVPSVIIPIEFNVLLNPTHSVYGDRVVGAGAVSVEQAAIMKTTA